MRDETMNDEAIKKALVCCSSDRLSKCVGCGISKNGCQEYLASQALNLINRLELENEVLKDAKNQIENELCNERMNLEHIVAEFEQLQRNLKQCENGYSQQLHLARCKIEELKNLCTSEDKLIKELRAENERLQKKYDRAMDNLKAVLKERAGEQNV